MIWYENYCQHKKKVINNQMQLLYRCDGVVVKVFASQSVDLGFNHLDKSYQKTLKKWYSQLSCLVLGI